MVCYYLTLEITGESLHKMYGLISHRFRPGMVCTHFSATVLYRHRERGCGGGGVISWGLHCDKTRQFPDNPINADDKYTFKKIYILKKSLLLL